jgi:hypothetical protein
LALRFGRREGKVKVSTKDPRLALRFGSWDLALYSGTVLWYCTLERWCGLEARIKGERERA